MDQDKALGATVIGVSNDEIDTLHKFSLTECGGKFPVAADPDQKIIKAYDAKMPLLNYATRVSYVITPDDKILYEYSALDPSQHVANTLNAIKQWNARSEEHTSELQSLMRISYAVFCLKKKTKINN